MACTQPLVRQHPSLRGGGRTVTLCVSTLLATIDKELPQALKVAFGQNLQSLAVCIPVDEEDDGAYLEAEFWLELAHLFHTSSKLEVTLDKPLDEESEGALIHLEVKHPHNLQLDIHHGYDSKAMRQVVCGMAAGRSMERVWG